MEIDLSKVDARTRAVLDGKFQDDFHRSVSAAIRRQTATAKAMREQPHLWKDDFGPMRLNVDPFIDAYMCQVYGHKWKEDRALVRWFVNRGNEEILARSKSPKIMIGYGGSPQSSVHSPQSSVHSPQSAVHSPQSAVHSPQSTVRSPQSPGRSPQLGKRGARFDRGTITFAK